MAVLLQSHSGLSAAADTPPSARAEQQAAPEKRRAARLVQTLSSEVWKEKLQQKQQGLSSWYGRQFHGKKTASGEAFDMHAMTAAHRTLPLQTWVRVTNMATGKKVLVRINDRGPRLRSRVIDLSYGAAKVLGFVKKGLARVEVEIVSSHEIEQLASR